MRDFFEAYDDLQARERGTKNGHMLEVLSHFRIPESRRAVLWLLPAALVYGILSALCWPSTYALSHMVIDYHFGFGKRGLIGAILELIDRPPYHYITLAWMAFIVLALWLVSLAAAARHFIRTDAGVASAFVVFFLSAGFASLVDDVGRGEHFGLLLAMPCLFAPLRLPWLPFRAALLVIAVLMQEVNYLFVVPAVAFDVWVGWPSRSRFRPALYTAAMVIPPTLLTWHLGNLRTACDTTSATAYFQHMVADFRFQEVPVATLCLDGKSNARLVLHAMWSVSTAAISLPLALSVALPSTLFNLMLTARALNSRILGRTIAVATASTPVALLIFGADVVRFVTLIQLSSLLVLVSTVRRLGLPPGGTLPAKSYRAPLIVTLAAFELGSSVTLTDGSQMLKFPFMPLVVRAVAVAQGQAHFVVVR